MPASATLRIDRYVVSTLMRDLIGHDRRPAAFVLYLQLRSMAVRDEVSVSYADLATATGLSKRAVQSAAAWLAGRRLVRVARASPTAVPRYRVLSPWRRRA